MSTLTYTRAQESLSHQHAVEYELPSRNTGVFAWNSLAFENGSDTQNYLPGKPTLERKPELWELRIRA